MKFVKANSVISKVSNIINSEPIKIINREVGTVHDDTDSIYFCIHELKELLKDHGYKIETEEEHRKFYSCSEKMFQEFFNKVLEHRAKAMHTENKINFNRENIFKNMFCFAKKLYIGNVVDSEGTLYPFSEPHHKIQGVPIKRSDMPGFCKIAAEELAFKIASGMQKNDAEQFIMDTYKKFCSMSVNEISAKKSISDYKKYVPEPIENYVKNGFHFDKGQTFNAKCSLAYNYIITKMGLTYSPIQSGSKFSYVYIKPDNRYGFEAIAFLENWPKEFNGIFEVDHETMFRKSFIPLFESMFKILKWIGDNDKIQLKKNKLSGFFF